MSVLSLGKSDTDRTSVSETLKTYVCEVLLVNQVKPHNFTKESLSLFHTNSLQLRKTRRKKQLSFTVSLIDVLIK